MTVLDQIKSSSLTTMPLLSEQTKPAKEKSPQQITMEKLKSTSQYFCQLIDTIPPKIYFSTNNDMLENIEMNKRMVFEDSDLSKKAKNKRIKLDPSAHKKISDIATVYCDKQKKKGKMNELRKKLAKRIKELRQARGAGESPKSSRTSSESSQNSPRRNNEVEVPDKIPKIYNKEGNLVFSKFDFASQVDLAAEKALEKSKQKKNSLKGLLVKAKKDEHIIAKLEKTNAEEASKLKEKKMWKSALEKAEGNKVRDNTKLLEKTLNKKNKMKVKHAKVWADRKKSVENRMQKKQDKRQRNINERKEQKKGKKLKLLKKKGHILG